MCGPYGWTTDQSKVKLGCTTRGPSFGQDGNRYAASYEDQDDLEDVGHGLAFLHVARVQLHVGVAPTGLLPGRSRGGLAEGAVRADEEMFGQTKSRAKSKQNKQQSAGARRGGGKERVYKREWTRRCLVKSQRGPRSSMFELTRTHSHPPQLRLAAQRLALLSRTDQGRGSANAPAPVRRPDAWLQREPGLTLFWSSSQKLDVNEHRLRPRSWRGSLLTICPFQPSRAYLKSKPFQAVAGLVRRTRLEGCRRVH